MLFMIQMQIVHSFYQNFSPSPLLATNVFHDSNANITFLLSKFLPPSPSWQLMLFMIQMQILHSFYQNFFPSPVLATNAFRDSNANITFLLSIFFPSWQLMLLMVQNQILRSFIKFFFLPPPSWQIMLFMIQMQILHSFYQLFFLSPLLATNVFHDSNANITFLLSIVLCLSATNASHDSKTHITILLSKFFPFPPPSWQLMLFMIHK